MSWLVKDLVPVTEPIEEFKAINHAKTVTENLVAVNETPSRNSSELSKYPPDASKDHKNYVLEEEPSNNMFLQQHQEQPRIDFTRITKDNFVVPPLKTVRSPQAERKVEVKGFFS